MIRHGELSSHLHLEHVKNAVVSAERTMFPFGSENSNSVKKMFESANQVVDRMNEIAPNPEQGRKGGVLLIQKEGEGNRGYTVLEIIGEDSGVNPAAQNEIERSNADKHTLYAIGKAMVLVNNPSLISSSQNLNLNANDRQHITLRDNVVPGGAIRVDGIIYSFSGYSTPEEDECVILAMLEERGTLDQDSALKLALEIGNKKYLELREKLIS